MTGGSIERVIVDSFHLLFQAVSFPLCISQTPGFALLAVPRDHSFFSLPSGCTTHQPSPPFGPPTTANRLHFGLNRYVVLVIFRFSRRGCFVRCSGEDLALVCSEMVAVPSATRRGANCRPVARGLLGARKSFCRQPRDHLASFYPLVQACQHRGRKWYVRVRIDSPHHAGRSHLRMYHDVRPDGLRQDFHYVWRLRELSGNNTQTFGRQSQDSHE